MGGGGTVWDGISYDPALDLLYVGVGNGGPWVRDFRSPGGGDNLFVASIVALKPDTGRYVWHYQTTPGDTWDFAASASMLLTELTINGRMRRVLMQPNKNGFFYVLDRETGEFISAQPFARVTWATAIDSRSGRPIESPAARYGVDGVILSPRPGGAHVALGPSFSPVSRLVYIPAVDGSAFYRKDPNFVFHPGRQNQGNGFPLTVEGMPPTVFFLTAWDPVMQRQRWRVDEPTGGTLTTAGNLVFAGAPLRRRLRAYHAETGSMLWESPPVPEIDFSNPITYTLDGKQYVSAMSPSHVVTFTLTGKALMPQR
jgi:quinohemoprotein ethanol dehydrogenase